MNRKILLLSATCVLTLFSCGGSKNKIIISEMNLSNAKSLFFGTKKNSNDGQQTLFKMTNDGYIEEVTYTDEDGKEIKQTLRPSWVKNINNKYLYVCFLDYPAGDNPYSYNYLINKEDNRAYRFPSSFAPYDYGCNGMANVTVMPIQEVFPTDGDGNIYCNARVSQNSQNGIKRINIQDPNNITATNASAMADSTCSTIGGSIAVDKDGNVAYQGQDTGGDYVVRFVTKDGSIKNIPTGYWSGDFWTGFDGHIYFNDEQASIKKISLINNELVLTKYGTATYINSKVAYEWRGSNMASRVYIPKFNKIILIDNDSEINELYNTAGEPKSTKLSELNVPLKSIKTYAASEDYIYLSAIKTNGDSVVGKLDVSGNTYTFTPYSTGIYDIYSLSVNSDEEISFSGLRMLDGAVVVGTIDKNGTEHLSDVQFDTQIDTFEEIKIG